MDEFAIDDSTRSAARSSSKSRTPARGDPQDAQGRLQVPMTVDGYDKPIECRRPHDRPDAGSMSTSPAPRGARATASTCRLLHRGLYLVRRELHRGAQVPNNAGSLTVIASRRRKARSSMPASRAGRGPPRRGPDAARRDVRLPAQGAGRRRARRRRVPALDMPLAAARARTTARSIAPTSSPPR